MDNNSKELKVGDQVDIWMHGFDRPYKYKVVEYAQLIEGQHQYLLKTHPPLNSQLPYKIMITIGKPTINED